MKGPGGTRGSFMTMARFVFTWLVLSGLSPALQAQDVRNLDAFHQHGQTFVTWTEVFDPGVRYRVYRDTQAIRSVSDLGRAEFLGEVDSESSYNLGRSLATNRDRYWVIREGDEPLSRFRGLFVHTPLEDTQAAHYAVTSVSASGENQLVRRGRNTTERGIFETVAPTRPVLQNVDATGELYAHWVTHRSSPFQEALSLRPSHGFNFRLEPGWMPGPRGLAIRLHAAGEPFSQGWPHRNEVQGDVDILAVSDLMLETLWTLWFGHHDNLPSLAREDSLVELYTQKRIVWTLDWIQQHLGADHDPGRVYAVGGSMGAMGSLFLAGEIPHRLAAVLCRNANFDLAAPDIANPWFVQDLLGTYLQDLVLPGGMAAYDRANASFMARRNLAEDWPFVRTLNGRNDETVGWLATWNFFEAMREARRPAVHYFDDHIHGPNGHWRPLHDTLLRRTFATRLDRPMLRFSDFSLDQSHGDGARHSGDLIGAINASIDYDPETARREGSRLSFDVFLRGGEDMDATAAPFGTVRLTPRRFGEPRLPAGSLVRYTLSEGLELKDERLLLADEHGLVETPPTPVTHTPRTARFDAWFPPAFPYLFLGQAPTSPGELQTILFGAPGEPWSVAFSIEALGDQPRSRKREHRPRLDEEARAGALLEGEGMVRIDGVMPESGHIDLSVPIQDLPALDGLHIRAQARVGHNRTSVAVAVLRRSP